MNKIFDEFLNELAKYNKKAVKSFLPGITKEEEEYIRKQSVIEVPDIAIEMLRFANDQNAYSPILRYSLLDHFNAVYSTNSMQRTEPNKFILFEDGCGGYMTYGKDGILAYDDEGNLILRFKDNEEMFDFVIKS